MPVALVTGCSSGFGAAIAEALAQRGYRVVATMRKPESAPPSLKCLAAEGPLMLSSHPWMLPIQPCEKQRSISPCSALVALTC